MLSLTNNPHAKTRMPNGTTGCVPVAPFENSEKNIERQAYRFLLSIALCPTQYTTLSWTAHVVSAALHSPPQSNALHYAVHQHAQADLGLRMSMPQSANDQKYHPSSGYWVELYLLKSNVGANRHRRSMRVQHRCRLNTRRTLQ